MLLRVFAAQEIASLVLPVLKALPEAIPSEGSTYLAQAKASVDQSKLQVLLRHTQRMAAIAGSHSDE